MHAADPTAPPGRFRPRIPPAQDTTRPVRCDPAGTTGPTRQQSRGSRWTRTSHGFYVPAGTDRSRVEQRIVEQSVRLGPHDAIAGWAALRWHGASYFTGIDPATGELRPIPLLRFHGVNRGQAGGSAISAAQLPPREREIVHDLPCTTAERAAFDEMRFDHALRSRVVTLEMAAAAGVVTLEAFTEYVAHKQAWTGVGLVRDTLALARPGAWSPQEVLVRLVCELDAGILGWEYNKPVFDLGGHLLGYPDLLHEESGTVVEYDGATHRTTERHSRDVLRYEAFRRHGFESVTVVEGQLRNRPALVARLRDALARARWLSPAQRPWTVEPPEGWDASQAWREPA